MEMIKYIPKHVDPDIQAINRIVHRQKEAMMAKAQKKTST